jgi:hypothetical protein
MRAHDEQFPQISIAHLRDAAQPLLAARRGLSRRQAKKGCELARARESGDVLWFLGSSADEPLASPSVGAKRQAPANLLASFLGEPKRFTVRELDAREGNAVTSENSVHLTRGQQRIRA